MLLCLCSIIWRYTLALDSYNEVVKLSVLFSSEKQDSCWRNLLSAWMWVEGSWLHESVTCWRPLSCIVCGCIWGIYLCWWQCAVMCAQTAGGSWSNDIEWRYKCTQFHKGWQLWHWYSELSEWSKEGVVIPDWSVLLTALTTVLYSSICLLSYWFALMSTWTSWHFEGLLYHFFPVQTASL